MDVYDVMRTTFAARDFTDQEVSDEVLFRILDNARFAPSGGNRQGWKVLVIKDREVRIILKAIIEKTIYFFIRLSTTISNRIHKAVSFCQRSIVVRQYQSSSNTILTSVGS